MLIYNLDVYGVSQPVAIRVSTDNRKKEYILRHGGNTPPGYSASIKLRGLVDPDKYSEHKFSPSIYQQYSLDISSRKDKNGNPDLIATVKESADDLHLVLWDISAKKTISRVSYAVSGNARVLSTGVRTLYPKGTVKYPIVLIDGSCTLYRHILNGAKDSIYTRFDLGSEKTWIINTKLTKEEYLQETAGLTIYQ